MATSEDVILKLLVEDQEIVKTIKNLDGFAKQVEHVKLMLDALMNQHELTYESMAEDIKNYQKLATKSGGTVQTFPAKVIPAALKQLEVEQQILEVKEKQAPLTDKEVEKEQELLNKARLAETMTRSKVERTQEQLQRDAAITKELDAQYAALKRIEQLRPADQVKALAETIPQMAQNAGVPINQMLDAVNQKFNITPGVIGKVERAIYSMKNGLVGTLKDMFNLSNIMNTAFGTLMAMVIFKVQMAVSQFFTDTLQQAKDLQNALGKLSIAETVLSKGGVEVTGKQLLDIVDQLKKEFVNISNVDMLKATGDTALRMADAGITPAELKSLLQAGMAAQIRTPGKTVEETLSTVTTAALTGNVEGLKSLGISMSDTMVQQYAKQAGWIEKISDKLTEQQKIHARIAIIGETTQSTLEDTLKLQNNLSASGDKFAASWKNAVENATPLVDFWNLFLLILAQNLDTIVVLFQAWQLGVSIIYDQLKRVSDLLPGIADTSAKLVNNINAYIFGKEQADQIFGGEGFSEKNLLAQDTATGIPEAPLTEETASTTEDAAKKIQSWLNDVQQAMEGFGDKAREMQEDFSLTMRRMVEDNKLKVDKLVEDFTNSMAQMDAEWITESSRFMEDWAIDKQKIIDDGNKEIADKEQAHRDNELQEEAKFQEQLRQLREKYLMSLEDALHERDARQVLRLARNYAAERQNAINEHNLRTQQDDTSVASDVNDIKKQIAERLAALDKERSLNYARMRQDYNTKRNLAIAEHKLEMDRMKAEFELEQARKEEEHQIDMDRLEHEKQDRLQELSTSITEQLGLTKIGADAVYKLLNSYYGPGGNIDRMMQWTYANTTAIIAQMAIDMQEFANKYSAGVTTTTTSTGLTGDRWWSTPTNGTGQISHGRASGGLDIVNSPTSVLMGEAGPEAHLFVPLNKLSTLAGGVNNLGSIGSSGGSSKVEVLVELSRDLEARIINKSMDGVSNAIMNVRKQR